MTPRHPKVRVWIHQSMSTTVTYWKSSAAPSQTKQNPRCPPTKTTSQICCNHIVIQPYPNSGLQPYRLPPPTHHPQNPKTYHCQQPKPPNHFAVKAATAQTTNARAPPNEAAKLIATALRTLLSPHLPNSRKPHSATYKKSFSPR